MKSLLLVEDNERIGSLTSQTLEAELGMPVIWVTTLAEADRLLKSRDPGVCMGQKGGGLYSQR